MEIHPGEGNLKSIDAAANNKGHKPADNQFAAILKKSIESTSNTGAVSRKAARLRNAPEIFAGLSEGFSASAAGGVDVVYQFNITGEQAGAWNVTVKNGTCKVCEGNHNSPTVTLRMSGKTLVALINGELGGMRAYLTGKIKVSGDFSEVSRIPELFSFE